VPVYRFQAGQEITYRSVATQSKDKEIVGTNEETVIWVAGPNSDGSNRMLARRTVRPYKIAENGDRTDLGPETFWALWDVFPDGRSVYNRTNEELDPQGVFITLPSNILEADQGWVAVKKNFWERDSYALDERSSDSLWIVRDVFWNPLVEIGRLSLTAEYRIDPGRGLVIRKEDTFIQTVAGKDFETVTVTTLDSVAIRDDGWLRSLFHDAKEYFRADSLYDETLVQAERDPKRTEDLLMVAVKALKDGRDRIESAELGAALDQQIAGAADDAKYILESAKQRAGFVNKRAKDWQAGDFAGGKHALKDYRKKVVIMDFWYRGCPWCVMAFPQVKKLASYYQGQPVAVLGMNIDQDESDARSVIEKAGLTYANLKAAEIAKDYGIRGYPHLVIIDQKGMIRDVHIGYTPDLFDQVVKSVDELLKK
jgi:peroxiredoxin